MEDARFWHLIDRTRRADPDAQNEALRSELSALQPRDIEAFAAGLDAKMRASYRWDLWGAAYVAMGGASDDSFEYFRLWLISRGQQAFEKVLVAPDNLADIAPDDPELLENEAFAHVAPDVWSEKTGKPWDDMPNLPSFFSPNPNTMPAGDKFPNDPGRLAAAYPKLWKRFAGKHSNLEQLV